MIAPELRPPFDAADKAVVDRYLASRGLKAFDPFADKDAGRDIIFTTCLAVARWMMEQSFATRTQSCRRFRGYPIIVESASPNAFAIDVEGVNVCGVHIGLVVSLFEISHFVFAQATLFPEIGDPSAERSPALPGDSTLSFLMADRLRADPATTGGPVGTEILPQDAQRNLAAHFLTQLMVRFAWLHEQFHALNGHCGVIAAQGRGVALNEMPDDRPVSIVEAGQEGDDPQWRLTLHCMEYDADRTALWAMMRMQESDVEPIDGFAAWPKAIRMKLTLFAGLLITFLFEQAARRRAEKTDGSHPLAYHRLHNLVRMVASNLLDAEGTTKALFDQVLTEMTRLRKQAPELFSPAQLLADLRDPDWEAAFDRAEEVLKAAREQFKPFAFA